MYKFNILWKLQIKSTASFWRVLIFKGSCFSTGMKHLILKAYKEYKNSSGLIELLCFISIRHSKGIFALIVIVKYI